MKLIKRKEKFILVSDEEIKEGDKVYFNGIPNGIVQIGEKYKAGINGSHGEFYMPYDKDTSNSYFAKSCIKIISENPDFSLLREEDCKEIGYVDGIVEHYIDNCWLSGEGYDTTDIEAVKITAKYFIEKSLNDKKFSLEDVRKAIKLTKLSENYPLKSKKSDDEIIQSLQKTEWDVEVEMEYIHDDTVPYPKTKGEIPKIINNSIKITKIL